MKFKYSPGLFGYGVIGADGKSGQHGLTIYFTDYNTTNDRLIIENAIRNNEDLWISSEPGTLLPENRTYNIGDIFIDIAGRVFRILNIATGQYIQTTAKLDTEYIFKSENIFALDFLRYFNIFDQSINYIVDDVFSNSQINYLAKPSNIYNVEPKNFARVQYTDVNNSSMNAFTLFSSADLFHEKSAAFGISRDINSNLFRIGNIDENEIIRGTELIFDVSSLMKNISSKNILRYSSHENEILRNDHISANKLFEGVFNSNPISFQLISTDISTIQISWNTTHFMNDISGMCAELYFYDASISKNFNPLIYCINSSIGTIEIKNLIPNNLYSAFIKIFIDGWGRRTNVRTIPCDGQGQKKLFVINPLSKNLIANTGGLINGLNTYQVDFSTNSLIGWNVTSSPWITCTPSSSITHSSLESFDVSVSRSDLFVARQGFIDIISEAPTETIVVTQQRNAMPVANIHLDFNNNGELNTNILGANIVDISILMHVDAFTYGPTNNMVSSRLDAFKNSALLRSIMASSFVNRQDQSGPDEETYILNISNVQSSSLINFTSLLHSGVLPGFDQIIEANAKAVITGIRKISGPDTIDSSWNAWYSTLLNGTVQRFRGRE